MNPWIHLDTAQIPGGGELRLMQRGQDYSIMSGMIELMNSRLYGSEVALFKLAWAKAPAERARSAAASNGRNTGMGKVLLVGRF